MERVDRRAPGAKAMLAAGLAAGGLAFTLCLGFLCWLVPGPEWWATLLPGTSLGCGLIGAAAERWPLAPPENGPDPDTGDDQ